jgi:antitoxin component of MazEF toxin-antitoxin module
MVMKAKVRTWGSSLGIIVPKEIVRKEHLNHGDEVIFELKKKKKIKEIFGRLKGWKIDSQKMKDESRVEWAK